MSKPDEHENYSEASTPLRRETLQALSTAISVPTYDFKSLSPGIVHFGVGNFHRAHQAVYLNELFERGEGLDWAIIGAGVLAEEVAQYESLRRQDFLSSVVEQSTGSSTAKITGAMIDFIRPSDTKRTIEVLSAPEIRIVSLTITEGGYFLTEHGDFDASHPLVKQDAEDPTNPSTVFGLLVAALRKRRESKILPFTVMSCDNIPHNGNVARNAVCGLARLINPELGLWIEVNAAFPNSMVDRITPVTGERERRLIQTQYSVADAVPVFCEDFRQWILEDSFSCGRPPLEDVGVQFVPDVSPYETMKIRILNGGHASIAYPAGLMDIEYVHEAMQDPLIKSFLMKLEKEEILPAVPQVPGIDLQDYLTSIIARFGNPNIGDTIRRLCFDGSNRQPKFVIPTTQDRLQKGGTVAGLALVSAFWCRYCYGTSDSGRPIEPNDPKWQTLSDTAKRAQTDPMIWLQQENIYGSMSTSSEFAAAFATALQNLNQLGARAALEKYVEESSEEH